MNHTFNIELAKQHGVDGAIILHYLMYWQETNKISERNFFDGRYWTYRSVEALTKTFPYWSESQIRRILKKLEKDECIVSGYFHKNKYNRTKWYSVNVEIHLTISTNGTNETHESNNIIETIIETVDLKEKTIKENAEMVLVRKKIIDYLNEKTNAKWKPNTIETKKRINARISEGFTLDDFFTCIDKKVEEWYGTEMGKWLIPNTLFSGKMERYVQTKSDNEQFQEMVDKRYTINEQQQDFDFER